ncbi:MAG: bifunctional 5,10-methylenetetrahydrofolate dehydrogenase/5,10-methenyltetrahydrofolate cyclohydrolase [Oscillospiraceae bacterium]|nr:bifunctional 5,10-methylenetetrahydrofolate dehydrogenase/5,10-methenyltetrahydrofolate cyclohydrolase [Oscillospiraceae bacterium]
MAKILRGAAVVENIESQLQKKVQELKARGICPTLAIIRVGDKADQISYEKSAAKRCESVGVAVRNVVLEDDTAKDAVLECIKCLNTDTAVHGVLILRPLPKHISDEEVRKALSPAKDIDGITEASLAGVFTGSDVGYAPCTAQACMRILDFYNIDCTGKHAVVIGRSLVVGKPVAMMLVAKNATVTICHTRTKNIQNITRDADIIIAATGKAEGLTGEYFSPGQVVIDVGINWNEEKQKLCGDVNFDEACQVAAAITPVPGGVGTVTTSVLVLNTVSAAGK